MKFEDLMSNDDTYFTGSYRFLKVISERVQYVVFANCVVLVVNGKNIAVKYGFESFQYEYADADIMESFDEFSE